MLKLIKVHITVRLKLEIPLFPANQKFKTVFVTFLILRCV
jgi:hypothetical protein